MDARVADARRTIDLSAEPPFRLGGAEINPQSREAMFKGGSERLQPQNLKVLIALARKRGKVVTREELVELSWDGRFIGDDVINRAISTLRQFAGRAGGFEIETIPRSGYRLAETSRSRRLPFLTAASAVVVLSALAGALFLESSRSNKIRPQLTIAVLPFTTASSAPQEHELASGTRDSVAHMLSQTRYRTGLFDAVLQSGRPTPDFIVSADVGSDSTKMGVTVRVEDTVHHIIVYSRKFEADRSNISDLPEEIGGQVAGSLEMAAPTLILERELPSDPGITAELFWACNQYSLGLGSLQNYQSARQFALKMPNSAITQIVLASTAFDALPDLEPDQRIVAASLGRRAAEQARVLAPGFGGNEILWCRLHSHARMGECEDHLRAGARKDLDTPWVDAFLADRLKDVGRTSEALNFAKLALASEQFVPNNIGLSLRLLETTGNQIGADDLYHRAIRWWPDDDVIFWDRVYGFMARGDFGALDKFEKEAPPGRKPDLGPAQPVLDAIKTRNVARLRQLCPSSLAISFKGDLCMLAFTRLGDNDDAFAFASLIYPDRIGHSPTDQDRIFLNSQRYFDTDLVTGPVTAPLRRDPRYVELARRLGLLAYWRSGRLPDFCQAPNPEPICSQLG